MQRDCKTTEPSCRLQSLFLQRHMHATISGEMHPRSAHCGERLSGAFERVPGTACHICATSRSCSSAQQSREIERGVGSCRSSCSPLLLLSRFLRMRRRQSRDMQRGRCADPQRTRASGELQGPLRRILVVLCAVRPGQVACKGVCVCVVCASVRLCVCARVCASVRLCV